MKLLGIGELWVAGWKLWVVGDGLTIDISVQVSGFGCPAFVYRTTVGR